MTSSCYISEEFHFPDYCQGSIPDKIGKIDGEVFRQLEGRTTLRFEVAGNSYFLKRHYGIGWGEIFKNLVSFRLPVVSAKNEWQAIYHLEKQHVDTMKAVAHGEWGINPAQRFSFIITEDLVNTISLEDLCRPWVDSTPEFTDKQVLLQRVASMAAKMHSSGMNHRDFYLCHFLMDETLSIAIKDRRISLIDLHRAQIRSGGVPPRWLLKDVAGLFFSAFDIGLTSRDCYRFISHYSGRCWRVELQENGDFWSKVMQKALSLYAKEFNRAPPVFVKRLYR